MDEAAINKLVEERVNAILASRETSNAEQQAIQMRVDQDKRVKDQALMRQAQMANGEKQAEAAIRQGNYARATSLEQREGIQEAARVMCEEVFSE